MAPIRGRSRPSGPGQRSRLHSWPVHRRDSEATRGRCVFEGQGTQDICRAFSALARPRAGRGGLASASYCRRGKLRVATARAHLARQPGWPSRQAGDCAGPHGAPAAAYRRSNRLAQRYRRAGRDQPHRHADEGCGGRHHDCGGRQGDRISRDGQPGGPQRRHQGR